MAQAKKVLYLWKQRPYNYYMMNDALNEMAASCTTWGHVAILGLALFTGICASYLINFAPRGRRPLHPNIRKH